MRARGGGGGNGGEPWRRGNSSTGTASWGHHDQQQQQQQQSQTPPPPPAGSFRGGRGRGNRTTSAPWSRLKPVELDPLDALGLPSKGDNRLLDFKTQEQYYTKIVERYMAFCSDAGERDELLRRFASLSVDASSSSSGSPSPSSSSQAAQIPAERQSKASGMAASRHASTTDKEKSAANATKPASSPAFASSQAANITASTSSLNPGEQHAKSLSDVLAALRKLREGIVASKRVDNFAIQAYLFCIRLAVLTKHPESYHAAMLHLLNRIHPRHNMTSVETHEVVSYLILDAACRRGNLAEAYAVRSRYAFKGRDSKVDAVLDALAHDNYVEFMRLKGHVDGHRARLLEYAEDGMRRHALKCFGKTYLSVELGYLEKCAGSKWAGLQANDGVGWEREGDSVVIRRV
ncbi:hypothetical protein Micbo1qcDRAFT_161924, partial [Microdochium bolleyi]